MTCICITLKLTLSMILYQVVLLASTPNFVKDENEFFFVKKTHGVVLLRGTVWTECSQVALCISI